MILNMVLVLCLAALAGLLYYCGGASKEEGHKNLPFLPLWMFASWVRDWLIPALACGVLGLLFGLHWSMLILYPAMGAALSAYHKWLNPFFKKPKTDCFWFNWLAHGLVIGLSVVPYVIFYQHNYIGLALLVAALGYSIMVWSEKQDKVEIEASGRGVLIILSLLLLDFGAAILLILGLVAWKKRKAIKSAIQKIWPKKK
jgi:hypothetical protein